jgi:uncharacterized protein
MPYLTLSILEKPFSIHRLPADTPLPSEVTSSPFFILTRLDETVSLILPEDITIPSLDTDPNWVCILVNILPHQDSTPILAHISAVLAEKGIQMYITSGLDAYYVLVRVDQLITAKKALENARCRFLRAQKPDLVKTE